MAAGFALREDDARRLWLVRAVEASDSGEQLLTHEDRAEAEAYARGEVSGTGKRSQAPFLAARSRFASEGTGWSYWLSPFSGSSPGTSRFTCIWR